MNSLKRVAFLCCGALSIAFGSACAYAQPYPTKPIRIITPFAPGGGTDAIVRILGERLSQSLGQSIIVDNRPGAYTVVGAVAAAKSPPDGYTLFYSLDSTMTLNQFMFSKLPYDSTRDFDPISLISVYAMLIATGPKLSVKSLPELISYGKANPGKLSYGTGSTIAMLAGELLKSVTGTDMVNIPFKGSAPAIQALLGGIIDFAVTDYGAYLPQHGKGRLNALGSTGSERSNSLPEVPTIKELGYPSYEVTGWSALYAPAGTPSPIIERLNLEVRRITSQSEYVKRIQAVTGGAADSSPAQLAAKQRADIAKWDALIKSTGINLLVE